VFKEDLQLADGETELELDRCLPCVFDLLHIRLHVRNLWCQWVSHNLWMPRIDAVEYLGDLRMTTYHCF